MFDASNRKFKIGDVVRVRKDLQVGKMYYTEEGKGDKFTSRMRNNLGKEGRIIDIDFVGYKLDIDPIHTYTEEMLEESYDELAKSNYEYNEGVEKVLINSQLDFYRKKIDEALDNRMFEKDKDSFKKLVEEYTRIYRGGNI